MPCCLARWKWRVRTRLSDGSLGPPPYGRCSSVTRPTVDAHGRDSSLGALGQRCDRVGDGLARWNPMFDPTRPGPFYEDFRVGATLPPLPSVTLTEADNVVVPRDHGRPALLVRRHGPLPACVREQRCARQPRHRDALLDRPDHDGDPPGDRQPVLPLGAHANAGRDRPHAVDGHHRARPQGFGAEGRPIPRQGLARDRHQHRARPGRRVRTLRAGARRGERAAGPRRRDPWPVRTDAARRTRHRGARVGPDGPGRVRLERRRRARRSAPRPHRPGRPAGAA